MRLGKQLHGGAAGVSLQALHSAFGADPRLFVATDGYRLRSSPRSRRRIDDDPARMDSLCEAMRASKIPGPADRGESVDRPVRDADRLLLIPEGDHREHGAE